MDAKTPSQSKTFMTDMVLPSETNPLNHLFGGELLARMDRAASIAARRHSRRICVTASVNHVAFNRAVPLGSVVTVEAKISRALALLETNAERKRRRIELSKQASRKQHRRTQKQINGKRYETN